MASTEFASGGSFAVERWSSMFAAEAISKTFFRRFAGRSSQSPIVIHSDLEKGAGDVIRHDLRVLCREPGVQGDNQLKDYEAAMQYYQDSFKIDQLRQAHEFRGMAQQRTVHELRTEARDSLSKWYAWVLDGLMFAYLAGTAGDGPETVSGILGAGGFAGNALRAASTNRVLDKSGDTMSIAFIDILVEMAKTVDPKIEPCTVDGKNYYILVMHPYGVTSLRAEAGAVISWQAVQQQVGPRAAENPIFTGALGMYNGVILHDSEYVPITSGSYAYNVFMGAQAGAFAMGGAHARAKRGAGKNSYFSWHERIDDYDNIMGIGVSSIFGMQKNQFNSEDLGTIQLKTADVASS